MPEHKFTNRLSQEKSPYLLQHAHNPVDWYPWNVEAFEKARREDKPIFLSIGYSTCHWCHVMERESFEDEEVAAYLNRHFISIKVDREERPDIDHVYMSFCQMLTGHGGWPLTILMTADQKPFYAGTYFPKRGRMKMPGLLDILERVAVAWRDSRDSLLEAGEAFVESIRKEADTTTEDGNITKDTFKKAFELFRRFFDTRYGGMASVPKFPTPHNLSFLLRYWKASGEEEALQMVEKTLDSMYRGGIFDHIGFGFSRYSTDKKWLVPHFEKMLYDNALLSIAYLEVYQATHKSIYAEVAEKIFTYITEKMTSPEGAFYAAEDADSEGEEGKFYVWSPNEIEEVLGERQGKLFCEYYDITHKGNFEGKSIPNRIEAKGEVYENYEAIEPLRRKVFEHREKRVHPFKDDKILTSWNGLMIAAMAMGGRILKKEFLVETAERAVDFIYKKLIREDGRLLARYRDRHAEYPGYVDDYAFMVWALIELYESTYKPDYLKKAIGLNEDMVKYFWDEKNGGLFLYGSDGESLISRPKELYDGALPSGNSVAAMNFIRLARITGNSKLEELADRQFSTFGGTVDENPISYTFFLMAAMFAIYPDKEVVIVGEKTGEDTRRMLDIISSGFYPNIVSVLASEDARQKGITALIPFVEHQTRQDGKSTAYVCENFACNAPVTDPERLKAMLNEPIH